MTKPTVYMLIGIPCSGKSTFVESQDHKFVHVSSDKYVDKFAARMGGTYNDVFKQVIPRATRLMYRALDRARTQNLDIVWDQTNLNPKSRSRKLAMLKDYRKVAIYFVTPPDDILNERLANRPGKTIPPSVIKNMKQALEYPTLHEGFDEIKKISCF